jgi:2-aminobenzoate-CoA ligase
MNADAEDLRAHCRSALAPYKCPKAVEFATALPRTESGKLRREALK